MIGFPLFFISFFKKVDDCEHLHLSFLFHFLYKSWIVLVFLVNMDLINKEKEKQSHDDGRCITPYTYGG